MRMDRIRLELTNRIRQSEYPCIGQVGLLFGVCG